MDPADYANLASEIFLSSALNRATDLPQSIELSEPVCIDCGVDITKRRAAISSATRCVECQNDHDRRRR